MSERTVVLGVSGSVAAYRAADLARELMRRGFTVRVCLTDAATEFVRPALFEALTGQPCLSSVFEEPERGRMAHIDWARKATVFVVAPASANSLAKLAGGIADDMLTTIYSAYTGPVVLAPAMNPAMFLSDAVRAAMKTLEPRAIVVEPAEGDVACGETGQGKLADIMRIAAAVEEAAFQSSALKGKKVLITSGPTQEPIDDVRYITNRSSGKMGAALARAALMMGADVILVTGPTSEAAPYGAKVIQVKTAEQMLGAALPLAPGMDWIVGAAAVADYRPESPTKGKIRRSGEDLSLKLTPNPDIIATLAEACPGKTVGFAAEPGEDSSYAQKKLKEKGLFAIAQNDISQAGIGFDADENELTLFSEGKAEKSGRRSKLGCAIWLWQRLTDR